MANNRMYLLCTYCVDQAEDGQLDLAAATHFLAKYYPSTGWYTNEHTTGLDEWFGRHQHGGMYGEYIYTVFEDVFGRQEQTKREILDRVVAVLSNIGQDRGEG